MRGAAAARLQNSKISIDFAKQRGPVLHFLRLGVRMGEPISQLLLIWAIVSASFARMIAGPVRVMAGAGPTCNQARRRAREESSDHFGCGGRQISAPLLHERAALFGRIGPSISLFGRVGVSLPAQSRNVDRSPRVVTDSPLTKRSKTFESIGRRLNLPGNTNGLSPSLIACISFRMTMTASLRGTSNMRPELGALLGNRLQAAFYIDLTPLTTERLIGARRR